MKETPIIMSGDHPKLILEGKKTMTRRTWGLNFINKSPNSWKYVWDSICQQHRFYDYYYTDAPPVIIKCPYGQVGDRLWVRETFMVVPSGVVYGANRAEFLSSYQEYGLEIDKWIKKHGYGKLISSIFMPRWASRIDLEITKVRVEMLQEITEEDCYKEGITDFRSNFPDIAKVHYPIHSFQQLWDSLNAKRGYGWNTNPWVWVITFKR